MGKVLGAGSFGIVREAVGKRTGMHYACKTIPKVPKRGKGTPRYLLKLQTEVDAMVQLGPSLDAVFLKVSLFDPSRIWSYLSTLERLLYPPDLHAPLLYESLVCQRFIRGFQCS